MMSQRLTCVTTIRRLVCEVTPDSARLIIDSHGATLPAPLVERFFDLLSIGGSDTSGGDVGPGPAVASRILSLFGGSIGVENLERGIRLAIPITRLCRRCFAIRVSSSCAKPNSPLERVTAMLQVRSPGLTGEGFSHSSALPMCPDSPVVTFNWTVVG
jgi:hypothetical protein